MQDETMQDETAATPGTAAAPLERERLALDDPAALSFLVQVAEELNATLDLDEVLRKVAERVKAYVPYDTFAVLLLDPLGQELRFRLAVGFPREVVEHWRFGLGQGIVGTVAQQGRPILVEDVRRDPRYIDGLVEARSELAIPLVARQRLIGVLDVASRSPGYFTSAHQRLLSFLAGHLANAVENARLYEKLREQARSLSLLTELGRELTSILDLEALWNKVAELVKRIVDYQLFSVMLWNDGARLLEHVFSVRFDERFSAKTGLPLGYGITGTAAALRQPLRVPNVHLDPRYVDAGHGVEVRSELVVPLVFKDRLIGVLDLESTEYNAFSEQHEQMLSTLASYIAVAIENARLYEQVRRSEQRLAEDLVTAREIQRGLLPESAPDVPGLEIAWRWQPARELGGDFYDFLPYGEGRVAIAVGDVAGKAAAAALQGALAIGVLREHVVTHPCEPAEMLAYMNQRLHQPRLDSRFVAMLFAVYDAADRSLRMANAGFTRPYWLRGGEVTELQVQGIPLGLMAGTGYEELRLQLAPGDTLVFCSDGLHDALGPRGEEFGAPRVGRLLRGLRGATAQELAAVLMDATSRHQGQAEPSDDRTVVVLRVRDESGAGQRE